MLTDRLLGRGAVSHDAIVSTPYGVIFQAQDGLFLTQGADYFEIGKAIRDWVSGANLVLHWDPQNRLLYVQEKDTHECAVCWINDIKQVRWTLLKARPTKWFATCHTLEETSDDIITYSMYDTSGGMSAKPLWIENSGDNNGVQMLGTIDDDVTYVGGATKQFTFTGEIPANSIGACVVVTSGVDEGEIRFISAADTGADTMDHTGDALTLAAGNTIVVGLIPFKLRFPPLVGTDPYVRKITQSLHVIGKTNITDEALTLYVDSIDNIGDSVNTATDSSGSIVLRTKAQEVPTEGYCTMRAAGRAIEVEITARQIITGGWDIYFVQAYAKQESTRKDR